jgi:hypothetical protein
LLELNVDSNGNVSGHYRSDLNGATYDVTGQVAADVPQKIAFSVLYPRARQDFDGLLWTHGKGAMAGTVTMLNHPYGFFAAREGTQFAADGEDAGPLGKDLARPGGTTVVLRRGEYLVDGKPRSPEQLTEILRAAKAANPKTWAILRVSGESTYDAIRRAFDTLGASGISTVRLAPDDNAP